MQITSATAITRELSGRNYRFDLNPDQIKELERLSGAGIGAIWQRVATLNFKFDDLRETVRLGLIGGGVSIPEASAIVKFAIDGRPVNEFFEVPMAILKAVFEGAEPAAKAEARDQSEASESADAPA